jgi:hypothetical protein
MHRAIAYAVLAALYPLAFFAGRDALIHWHRIGLAAGTPYLTAAQLSFVVTGGACLASIIAIGALHALLIRQRRA